MEQFWTGNLLKNLITTIIPFNWLFLPQIQLKALYENVFAAVPS